MSKRAKRFLYRIAEWLGPWIIRMLGLTLRIEKVNFAAVEELIKNEEPILWCIWHGRMYLPMFVHRGQGIVVMISQHEDGEMIARIVKKLGYGTVRGSSTRGGKEAFYAMLDHLRAGRQGGMLPDGPTGPRHHFKSGSLFLAQQSQCYLVPLTFAARPCWKFRSWDQFVLPKPFARSVICYGDPLKVPPKISPDEAESWRRKLETLMIELVKSAEAHLDARL